MPSAGKSSLFSRSVRKLRSLFHSRRPVSSGWQLLVEDVQIDLPNRLSVIEEEPEEALAEPLSADSLVSDSLSNYSQSSLETVKDHEARSTPTHHSATLLALTGGRRHSYPASRPHSTVSHASDSKEQAHEETSARLPMTTRLSHAYNEDYSLDAKAAIAARINRGYAEPVSYHRLAAQLVAAKKYAAVLTDKLHNGKAEFDRLTEFLHYRMRENIDRMHHERNQRIVLRAEIQALEALRTRDQATLKAIGRMKWLRGSKARKQAAHMALQYDHSEERLMAKMREIGMLEVEIKGLQEKVAELERQRALERWVGRPGME